MKASNPSLIMLVAIIVVMMLKVSTTLKWILVAALLIIWIVLKMGTLFYISAYRDISKNKATEKSWKKLQKALKFGIGDQMKLTAASLYIQKGDHKIGAQILNDFISKPFSSKNEKEKKEHEGLVNVARTMRSMAFWLDGDLDGAINEMETTYQTGYRDKNMFINYETYVLEKGDLKRARELLSDSAEDEKSSNGLKDNHGWYALQKGDWATAESIFTPLVQESPKFPEPYVHMAQVLLHYGKVQEALDQLNKGVTSRFTQTSSISLDFLNQLIAGLSDPKTRIMMARSIDADPVSVAKGKIPTLLPNTYESSNDAVLTGFVEEQKVPAEATTGEEEQTEEKREEAKQPEKLDEERAFDTSLTADDDAYLKSHGLS